MLENLIRMLAMCNHNYVRFENKLFNVKNSPHEVIKISGYIERNGQHGVCEVN